MKETAVYCCGKDFSVSLRNDFVVKTPSTVERSVLNQYRAVDTNLSMVAKRGIFSLFKARS